MKITNFEIKKETKLALKIRASFSLKDGSEAKATIWLPKSQIVVENNTIEMPEWLALEKEADVCAKLVFI